MPNAQSFTPPKIAEKYGVSPDKVCGWIAAGELRAVNVAAKRNGRPRWSVTAEALAEFERARSATPPPPKPIRQKPAMVGVRKFF